MKRKTKTRVLAPHKLVWIPERLPRTDVKTWKKHRPDLGLKYVI